LFLEGFRLKDEDLGHKDARAKAEKLLADSKIVFLGTNGSHGHPNLRAMVPARVVGTETIWFATGLDSSKILELIKSDKAVVYAYAARNHSFFECRLWGNAVILEDAESRRQVWSDEFKEHFPGGVDDPNLRVLRFDVRNGVYSKDGKSGGFKN
jgi:general stress protein 26